MRILKVSENFIMPILKGREQEYKEYQRPGMSSRIHVYTKHTWW